MVFGGFMVVSALGIVLVSTFSMKETSYEEAMAKQRMELGKMAPLCQLTKKDKKKEKKKNRGKKKDDKPNGKLPESEPEVQVSDPEPAPVTATEPNLVPAPKADPNPAPEPAPVPTPKPAPKLSPKSSPKPASAPAPKPASAPAPKPASAPAPKPASAPAPKPASAPAPKPASAPAPKPASAPAPKPASAPAPKPASAPAPKPASAPAPKPASAPAPKPASAPAPKPASAPAPKPASAPAPKPASAVEVPPGPIPKKKKEKKLAKAGPAQVAPDPVVPSKSGPALEAVTTETPVMAMPPVASLKTAAKGQDAKGQDAKGQDAKGQDAKGQEPSKKKASGKKKTKPAAEADPGLDSPLSLPYKALVSSVSSMAFSEAEAQRLIDLLSDKAGLGQDTWHKTTPKGDPVAVLKKQLEENQKQLAAQQEDAAAAKTKLRELTRELSAEKTKVTGVETRLSSQLSSREQEMIALQARMQASYQDHLAQTQNLNTKILSLQEQLESGPTAQLTRLQQENSILRDALNQATSQAESKQNAELAKLRLDCSRLTKELGEKSVSLQAEEKVKRSLEAKTSAAEKQLAQLQVGLENTRALERRLEEVSEELRSSQSTLEKAQQEAAVLSDLQIRLGSLEADLKERSAKVDALTAQLGQTELEKRQLEDQVGSINVLLEASQNKEASASDLAYRESQVRSLEEEVKQLRKTSEQVQNGACLKVLFMFVLWLPIELLEKLKEAEDSHSTLHAECDQYRTVLAETEGMLKDLQKSVEEEELVWKSKMADSQDQLAKALGCVHTLEMTTERLKAENQSIGKLKEQVMLLEAQLEKQSEIASTEEEMEQVH
uniref:Ribosome receptor lysine/proline rich domain-containing protein n=1 Tax=Esox lucius TaxID=8010 RepID=A0A3P8Y857_ESOLU